MQIEWQVRAVKGDVVFKGQFQLSVQRARHRLQTRPKQSVVHEQKIEMFFGGFLQGGCRPIDCCTDFCHAPRVFDLQTVERVFPIANFAHTQIFVCVFDDLSECWHAAILCSDLEICTIDCRSFHCRSSTAYWCVNSARTILLIGFMVAGKSSVGLCLQTRTALARSLVDEIISTRFQLSIPPIFSST